MKTDNNPHGHFAAGQAWFKMILFMRYIHLFILFTTIRKSKFSRAVFLKLVSAGTKMTCWTHFFLSISYSWKKSFNNKEILSYIIPEAVLLVCVCVCVTNCASNINSPISSEIMDGFWCSRCLNDRIGLFYMIGSFASGANFSLMAKNGTRKNIPLLWLTSSKKPRIKKFHKTAPPKKVGILIQNTISKFSKTKNQTQKRPPKVKKKHI